MLSRRLSDTYYEEFALRYAILALIKMRCLITRYVEYSRLRPLLYTVNLKVQGMVQWRGTPIHFKVNLLFKTIAKYV